MLFLDYFSFLQYRIAQKFALLPFKIDLSETTGQLNKLLMEMNMSQNQLNERQMQLNKSFQVLVKRKMFLLSAYIQLVLRYIHLHTRQFQLSGSLGQSILYGLFLIKIKF